VKQSVGTVAATGKPLKGLDRPQGQNIRFSQTITLGCPKIASIARPGQFVMVNCGPDCTLPRPFSVHQVIDKERLVLYFAVLEDGKGTDWLSNRRKGDAVSLFGPLGNGFSVQPSSHNLLLVAGGIGVAPLHFLAEETLKNGHSVTMLYGTADETSYPEALPRLELVRATEDGSVGHHGMVTDLLPKLAGWADQIFACGPTPMYQAMSRMPELRTKLVQVSLEIGMACGRGVCYGCTIKTKQGLKKVCQHGPVFNLEDILWE
jgi:dihydroorotate dehydrogenase electron transfer subunit